MKNTILRYFLSSSTFYAYFGWVQSLRPEVWVVGPETMGNACDL